MTLQRVIWSLAICGLASTAALAQPSVPDKPGDKPAGDKQPVDERAALKARLDRWLADNKRTQERLEAAIKKFDAGAPTAEVRAEFEGSRFRGDPSRGPGRGPREPDHGPPQPGAPNGKMSHDDILAFLNKEFPEIGKRFQDAGKDNPGLTGRILDRMEPNIREIIAERDPEMRQLRSDSFRSGFDLMAATREFIDAHRKDAQAADTKEKLEKLRSFLGSHFDLQLKLHKQEIVQLERRIAELREDLDKKLSDRQKFIDKRIDDTINRPQRNRQDRDAKPAPTGGS